MSPGLVAVAAVFFDELASPGGAGDAGFDGVDECTLRGFAAEAAILMSAREQERQRESLDSKS